MGFLNKKNKKIMPLEITNGIGKVGVRNSADILPMDSDAQAFITAAALTDTTQKSAVDELVKDLKAAGLWTKMNAVYPMVGGTSTAHQYNLKDPRDLNAAFRLNFFGGLTHSPTGILPNASTGYANTNLVPSSVLNSTSNHVSVYVRNYSNQVIGSADIFAGQGGAISLGYIYGNSNYFKATRNFSLSHQNYQDTSITNRYTYYASQFSPTTGFININRISNSIYNSFTNGSYDATYNIPVGGSIWNSIKLFVALSAEHGGQTSYSNRELSFATIGTGLTTNELTLQYLIIEKFQKTLSRNVNPTLSYYYNGSYETETNNFLYATQISDVTIGKALNTLVKTLKTAGIWTKMKAVYPMVGGTATSHKFNLVNPVDTNAAFRLVFNGGWTHSSTGALPNGSNTYADTFLTPSTSYSVANSGHLSYYSRTDSNVSTEREMGAMTSTIYSDLALRYSSTSHGRWGETSSPTTTSSTNSLGFYIASRTTSNSLKLFKNGNQVLTSSTNGNSLPTVKFYIGSQNVNNTATSYSSKQCAFASIGDGLTDAEATTFYNAVQAFQTTLGRQV